MKTQLSSRRPLHAPGIAILALVGACALFTRAHAEPGHFPTVGFEVRHEVTIPFPVEAVQPLFEPSGRHLVYKWWNPTVLREPDGPTLKGLVTVSRPHESDSHEIFLMVTQHNPDRGHLQYLVLWNDFELQRIDITCVPGDSEGSTQVIWEERNAGLHENGVKMVTHFVEGEKLQHVVDRYAEQVAAHLKSKATEQPE